MTAPAGTFGYATPRDLDQSPMCAQREDTGGGKPLSSGHMDDEICEQSPLVVQAFNVEQCPWRLNTKNTMSKEKRRRKEGEGRRGPHHQG